MWAGESVLGSSLSRVRMLAIASLGAQASPPEGWILLPQGSSPPPPAVVVKKVRLLSRGEIIGAFRADACEAPCRACRMRVALAVQR